MSEEARRLHQEAFVFDGHVHMINRQLHLGGNIGDRLPDGQVDLPRMKEGGVDAFFMTLFVMEQYYAARYETKQTLRLMNMAWINSSRTGGRGIRASTRLTSSGSTGLGRWPRSWISRAASISRATSTCCAALPAGAPRRAAPRSQLGERVRRLLLRAGPLARPHTNTAGPSSAR